MPKGKRKPVQEIDPDQLDELERWHDLAWRESLADALLKLSGLDESPPVPRFTKSGHRLH